MTFSGEACPLEGDSQQVGLSAPADANLVADGWVRRHFVDPNRVQESVDLYESMGFEVRTRKPDPSEFSAQCQLCASTNCDTFVLIYTRKETDSTADKTDRKL